MSELSAGDRSEGVREPALLHVLRDPASLWQLSWALVMLITVAALLVLPAQASSRDDAALLVLALPAVIGVLWPPKAHARVLVVVCWAIAAAVAATLTGGLGGPLVIWCLLPALVSAVIEGPLIYGFALCICALLAVTIASLAGYAQPPPAAPYWLTFISVLAAASAAVAGVEVVRRRSAKVGAEAQAELRAFQTVMGDLPDLALVIDHNGRAQAVFGRMLQGLDAKTLHASLFEAVDVKDRSRLRAAIDEAMDHGRADAILTAIDPIAPQIAASFQRTTIGRLAVILREVPVGRLQPGALGSGSAQLLSEPLVALSRRVEEAEAGRARAEDEANNRARFLANMSHELRTPLNAIMGFSDIMKTRLFGDLSPKYLEYAELIHESGGHLLDLINDVLDMSKIEAQRYELSLERFDAREPVSAALKLMRLQADDKSVNLRGGLSPVPLEVDADRRAIKQIVLNLVSNALKFTPAGGEVTLSLLPTKHDLELVVADTGVGIAPEDLERLGRPYQQAGDAEARGQGTGLGLSLVRALAELHGGKMMLESRLGEGTAVTVRLPVLAGEAPLAV